MNATLRRLRSSRVALITTALVLVFAAVAAYAHLKVDNTSPEEGAVVDKPVRSLRVWFNQEPDVSLSKLELEGPKGPLAVEGLHTMGEKDLMARVSGAMPDGEYTARWQTAGDDGHVLEGEWKFTVKRASR